MIVVSFRRILQSLSPGGQNAPDPSDAWERWFLVWHVLFYGGLASTIFAVLLTDTNSMPDFLLTVGLSFVFGIWYWVFVVRHPERRQQLKPMLTYFAGAFVLFFVLVNLHYAFYLMASILFLQVFTLFSLRWVFPGAVALLGMLLVLESVTDPPDEWNNLYGVVSLLVTLGMGVALAVFLHAISEQSRERRQLIGALQATRTELASQERRRGILEERQRVAREIHDTLAQQFTSIVMMLEAADQVFPDDHAKGRRYLDRATGTARDGLEESRRLIWALRPEALEDVALAEAITREADRCSKELGLDIAVEVTGDARKTDPDIEVALLRAVQEALVNIRKHAKATKVVITLSYLDETIALDVVDNGLGFDGRRLLNGERRGDRTGFGLTGMRERVEILGGSLAVESEPGTGTAISVALPMPTPAA